MFSFLHFVAMCFDVAISTADVGIGSPASFTELDILPNLIERSIDSYLINKHYKSDFLGDKSKEMMKTMEVKNPFGSVGK